MLFGVVSANHRGLATSQREFPQTREAAHENKAYRQLLCHGRTGVTHLN
jgi:hypothetical protein